MKELKVITLWEPWATLVAIGAKAIETRCWPTNYRGEIFIHSAQRMTREQLGLMELEPFYTALRPGGIFVDPGLNRGKIIARTEILGCEEIWHDTISKLRATNEWHFGDYTPGRFAWKLAEPQRLIEPVPIRGLQRIWNWSCRRIIRNWRQNNTRRNGPNFGSFFLKYFNIEEGITNPLAKYTYSETHANTRQQRKEGEKVGKTTVKNGIRFYRFQLKNTKGEKDAGQLAMAEFIGRPRYLISMWESGDAFPSPPEVIKLAEFLEVTPGHLYTAKQLDALHALYGPQEGDQ